jgi:hypothetical protein
MITSSLPDLTRQSMGPRLKCKLAEFFDTPKRFMDARVKPGHDE